VHRRARHLLGVSRHAPTLEFALCQGRARSPSALSVEFLNWLLANGGCTSDGNFFHTLAGFARFGICSERPCRPNEHDAVARAFVAAFAAAHALLEHSPERGLAVHWTSLAPARFGVSSRAVGEISPTRARLSVAGGSGTVVSWWNRDDGHGRARRVPDETRPWRRFDNSYDSCARTWRRVLDRSTLARVGGARVVACSERARDALRLRFFSHRTPA